MTTKIIDIYAWTDFMSGCDSGKLMCLIKFNKKVKDINIKKIMFSKCDCTSTCYIHDISFVDGHKYEIREDDVIIRKGPSWSGEVNLEVTIEDNGKNYILKSESIKIKQTF